MLTAPIAAPLVARTVPADGLTFTARKSHGGLTISTVCPTVAARCVRNGMTVEIVSRPEHAAQACTHCHGEHR